MDFTIVYCVTLTSYGKALYLHFYYLTIWTHCTCMYVYILSEIKCYYYYYYYYYNSVSFDQNSMSVAPLNVKTTLNVKTAKCEKPNNR